MKFLTGPSEILTGPQLIMGLMQDIHCQNQINKEILMSNNMLNHMIIHLKIAIIGPMYIIIHINQTVGS